MKYFLNLSLSSSKATLEVYNKNRGINEVRPTYSALLRIDVTSTSASTAIINWGDSAGTVENKSLVTGSGNILSFQYTGSDASDVEKKVSIEFANFGLITSFAITTRSEATKFGPFGFDKIPLTTIDISSQLLTGLPRFKSGLQSISCNFNDLTFDAINTALTNCKNTLITFSPGSGIQSNAASPRGQNLNNIVSEQIYDLRGYVTLQNANVNNCGIADGQVIFDSSNTALISLKCWGNGWTMRPEYMPPSTQEILFSSLATTASTGISPLVTAIPVSDLPNLRKLDMTNCWTLTNAAAQNETVSNIYNNRASFLFTGVKNLNTKGNNTALSGTYQAPSGYIQATTGVSGSDGTPASSKEMIYVLENQNVDESTIKKYNWVCLYN